MAKPVDSFIGRESELSSIHQMFGTDQKAVVICGHGGIGKSELVSRYCSEYRQHYEFIAWVNAETPFSTNSSFINLAKHLQITTVDGNNKELEIKEIVQKIFH